MRFHNLPTSVWRRLLLATVCVACCGCTDLYYYGPKAMMGTRYLEGYDPRDPRYYNQQQDSESWWRGDGVAGSPSITISLSQQKAYFYRGGKLVGVSIISTGDWEHPTPRGHFTVQQKDRWHQSSQYGDYVDASGAPIQQNIDRKVDPAPRGAHFDGANMFYFLRITSGIGMHAGYLPGYPASHGCIRLPQQMAEHFFQNGQVGMPVDVKS